jgi:hypothetical protein
MSISRTVPFVLATAALLAGACGEGFVADPDRAAADGAGDEVVSTARGALSVNGACEFFNDLTLGSIAEWAREAKSQVGDKFKKMDTLCAAYDEFVDCGSTAACAAPALLSGVCEYLASDAVQMTHPLAVFSQVYVEVVAPNAAQFPCAPEPPQPPAGMSSLHCCRYDESQPYCHSGFEAPSINCSIDYGNASLNHLGLPTCEHIPECATAPPPPTTPLDLPIPTVDGTLRTLENNYLKRVLAAGEDRTPEIPAWEPDGGEPSACKPVALFDLASFRGCRNWEDMIREARVFSGEPEAWVAASESAVGYPKSAVTMQVLANFAATRIVFGVPNGPDRIAAANSAMHYNYATSPDDYIANLEAQRGIDLDPEAELRKWLSPCALELLKSVLGGWWQVVAYPTLNETPTTLDHTLYEDACVQGGKPRLISVRTDATSDPNVRRLVVEAEDPDMARPAVAPLLRTTGPRPTLRHAPVDEIVYETADGKFTMAPFRWNPDAATSVNSYSYPLNGASAPPSPRLAIMSSSGLVDAARP